VHNFFEAKVTGLVTSRDVMPANPHSGLIEPRVIKIFVAYDQPEAGDRAEALCAQLEQADEFPFEVQPWRANPVAVRELNVRNAATHADILVLAWASPEGPPEYLVQSVLEWAVNRVVPNATLAALPVGTALTASTSVAVFHRLRQLASANGMTFVCDWSEGLAPHPPEMAAVLHDREQLVTPTLLGILSERHLEPHLEWGLNE
jgi:hypothetical protein